MWLNDRLMTRIVERHVSYTVVRVKELLQQGANVNTQTFQGSPLLWYLITLESHYKKELVDALLDANPRVIGQPPLLIHIARNMFYHGIQRVIAMEAPLFEVNDYGETALHMILQVRLDKDIATAFVEKDAVITLVRNRNGNRPRDVVQFCINANSEQTIETIENILFNAEERARVQIMTCLSSVIVVSALVPIIFDYL